MLNQLHRNVVWGLRGNFLDVPTDCPQRDERLGWTGDIAVVRPVRDLPVRRRRLPPRLAARSGRRAAGRRRHGAVRRARRAEVHRAARTTFPTPDSTAIWSDAAVWVPWALWQAYGDLQVLRDQFDSMAAHVRRVETLLSADRAVGHRLPVRRLARSHRTAGRAVPTPRPTTAWWPPPASTATRHILGDTAPLLGRSEDAAHFAELAERTRAAFNEHYVHDRRHDPQRRRDRVRAGHRLRPARRDRPSSSPASGWRSWSPRAATTSRPASPARRSSPMR